MIVEKLTARQVMSRVLVAVDAAESVPMAWEIMRRAGVHHLPVVRGPELLGVLTREKVIAAWSGGPQALSGVQARTLVNAADSPCVREDEPLTRVCSLMVDAGCDAVPVRAGDGSLAGLITARDVLAAVAGRTAPGTEDGHLVTGMFRLEPVLPAMGRRMRPGAD
ncbi:CBS domain-containing protein [Nonomuraea sp. NBC_01738]|uniref:CBS domain-containing protein n=1 Tax=Nonomuraea sp. NBC_01738 TaxID=2976003 RepID=UPI002E11B53A|nr:CBS domain-containing protein [Nonomuraea sp. NBC_01738]